MGISLAALRSDMKGPVKVYTPTGEVDGNGELLLDPETGEPKKVCVIESLYYRPFVLTPGFERGLSKVTRVVAKSKKGSKDRAQEAQEAINERPLQEACQMLIHLVGKWDLYATDEDRENKNPIPLTMEGLMDVPAEILYATIGACSEASQPPKERPKTSQSSFSPKEEQE